MIINNTIQKQSPVTWGFNTKLPSQYSTSTATKTSTAPSLVQSPPLAKSILPPPPTTSVLSPTQNLSQYGGTQNSGLITPPKTTSTSYAPVNTPVQTTQPQPIFNNPTLDSTPKTDSSGFSGLVSRVVGASNPTGVQTGLVSDLQNIGLGNQAIGERAQDISDKYAPEINRIGQLGAGAVAGNLSTGTNVVGSGNANLAAMSVSSRIDALQKAMNAELSGVDKQLTAQSQQAGAFGQALGGANTQQAQQISGLGTATGFAQPVQVPYSNQFVNPQTGQSAGGAGLGGYAGFNAAEQTMELILTFYLTNCLRKIDYILVKCI